LLLGIAGAFLLALVFFSKYNMCLSCCWPCTCGCCWALEVDACMKHFRIQIRITEIKNITAASIVLWYTRAAALSCFFLFLLAAFLLWACSLTASGY
jgi:hypothetical protein